MIEETIANTGAVPGEVSADAGCDATCVSQPRRKGFSATLVRSES